MAAWVPMNGMELPIDVADPARTSIHASCWYQDEGDDRGVFVRGLKLFHYGRTDKRMERVVCVSLVELGHASQRAVATAFECGVATLRRWPRRFESAGLEGLARKGRRSPLLVMGGAKDAAVRRFAAAGWSNLPLHGVSA